MLNFIEKIEEFIATKISYFKTIVTIFKLEARLAQLSVYPILLNLCFFLVVLITLWLSIMVLFDFMATFLLGNVFLGTTCIVLLNIFILLWLINRLKFNFNNICFKKTQEYLLKKRNIHDNDKKDAN